MNSTKVLFDPDDIKVKKDVAAINSWRLQAFYLKNLPSILWWGIRIKSFSPYRTEIQIPYNWRNTNPFRSIYFAALAGAGELSSGLMAGLVVRHMPQKVSMLVTDVSIQYIKKANSTTTFVCDEGIKLIEGVQTAIDTGSAVEVPISAQGRRKDGELAVRFHITWSFRVKS